MKNVYLKPCPFCGEEDITIEREGTHRQSTVIVCENCGCRMESNEIGEDIGSKWNNRVECKSSYVINDDALVKDCISTLMDTMDMDERSAKMYIENHKDHIREKMYDAQSDAIDEIKIGE